MSIDDVTVVQRAMQAFVDRDTAGYLDYVSDAVRQYVMEPDGRAELAAAGKAEYASRLDFASLPADLGFKRFQISAVDTEPDGAGEAEGGAGGACFAGGGAQGDAGRLRG